jgi:hypothetical protein
VLYREPGDPIFERADEEALRALLPCLARALLQRGLDAADYSPGTDASAWVNLDAAGRIVHLSGDAHRLLLLAHGGITPAGASREPSGEQFGALGVVRRQLALGGENGAPCSVTLTKAWGRFEFRGDRLRSTRNDGDDLIGITIQRSVPSAVRTLRSLDAAPLSITQKRSARCCCAGWVSARSRSAWASRSTPRSTTAARCTCGWTCTPTKSCGRISTSAR